MTVIFTNRQNEMMKNCREHTHDCYELIVTTGGSNRTVVGDAAFDVKRGSIVIIPPNRPHSHASMDGFTDIYVYADTTDPPIEEPMCFHDSTDTLVTAFDMIYMNYVQKEFNYENINTKLLELVFEYVTRLRKRACNYEFVWKFKERITANLSNPAFDIPSAAEDMGISFEYMRHCFKAELKTTPLEYLTAIRIRQAKRLLRNSRIYRISEIAEMCGYKDPYYFSKAFRKSTGMSPRQYRESAV